MEKLSGKTALVTGSTDGVGRLVARKLGQAGARVLVHGRDAERGARVVADIEASGVAWAASARRRTSASAERSAARKSAALELEMNIAAWLRGLDLERYERAFRDNDIDA